MVPTPENFTLHPTVQTELPRSPGYVKILDPNEPIWLLDLNLFIEELKTNFRTYNPVSKAEAKLEALQMHDSHQATNISLNSSS